MKYKVVKVDNRYEDIKVESDILNKVGADLIEYNLKDENKIIEATRDADGIIADLAAIGKKVLDSLEKCRVISKVGIGVDNIDISYATEKGILVCNVPDYCFNEVSDHAVSLILCCARKVCFLNSRVKKGFWGIEEAKPTLPLDQMTLGIIGFGKIARLVVKKALVFGFKIIIFDPYIDTQQYRNKKINFVDLDTLLNKSDIVSIHCPATPETMKLFDIHKISKMKRNAFLVNTSRGAIIDNQALYLSLKENIIGGAAVDVYNPEPINPDDPILSLDNFVITPHFGFYSERSIMEVRKKSAENIARILSGKKPENVVNKELLKKENIMCLRRKNG